jgi:hypothetical protein
LLADELDLSSARRRIVSFIKRKVEEGQTDGAGKLNSMLAKYEASEHKRRMPEICKLR